MHTPPETLEQQRYIFPSNYATFSMEAGLKENLSALALNSSEATSRNNLFVLQIPMPDGSFQRFEVWSDPILHPDLAERYPQIMTFAGRSLDQKGSSLRMDLTPQGFHAQILSPGGSIYIDPYAQGQTEYYISYHRQDYRPHPFKQMEPCSFRAADHDQDSDRSSRDATMDDMGAALQNTSPTMRSSGTRSRIYRMALACTGEYSIFHGGTVVGALSAMTTTMNRVNGIYERDFGVRMELIANNDELVFLDPATDPYTNNSGFAMLGQNQSTINSIIGAANYDIGHVFSTGGGGVASFGTVCSDADKARGVTGAFAPIGDPFDVDYVAHEIGHQFRGEHSWNYCGAFTSGGIGSTDFEPGGGSTIMGYAGICGSDDYAFNSDDYFHGANLVQMFNFINTGGGGICPMINLSGNTAPEILSISPNTTIPVSTPFELSAVAYDAQDDVMSYCWEQMDGLTNVSLNVEPTGTFGSPLFRSFPPDVSPTRYFPSMNLLVTNSSSRVEWLPDYSRNMRFQLTIRDNHPGSGGAVWQEVLVSVDSSGGPFFITEPQGTGIVWEARNWYPVSWEPGNTRLPPFDCESVHVLLSDDGGYTYPIVLNDSVTNDGLTYVYVPQMTGNNFRVRVGCNENIFFNINDANISIEDNNLPSGLNESAHAAIRVYPNPSTGIVWLDLDPASTSQSLELRLIDITGRALMQQSLPQLSSSGRISLDLSNYSKGIYLLEWRNDQNRSGTQKLILE